MAAAVLTPAVHPEQRIDGVPLTMEQYLRTTYRPDREYIDGKLLERNVGKWEHSRLQALLTAIFYEHEAAWSVYVATEQRTQTSSTRVRIPDVLLVPAQPQPDTITEPPILVVEILSPDDTYVDTQRRASDYLSMGVNALWIIDSHTRTGRECVGGTWTAATVLRVPGTAIELDLTDLFRRLDASPRA